MEHIAQCLMGDRRALAPYDNAEHVPYPLNKPLTLDEVAGFLDKDELVTFTAKVPLAEVARAADGTLAEYIEAKWLSGHAVMLSPEYRAIGATFEAFDCQFAGLVHLQVTCQLQAPFKG